MEKKQKIDQTRKARVGAIGENMVVAKLMQQGWDAFNANCTIKNYKSIDIVCLNADLKESDELWWKPRTSLVQVKTSVQNNIPAGFSIKEALDKDYLQRMVKGPYVFVSAKPNEDGYAFRYFIISRSQFIDLLYVAHKYYVNVLHQNDKIELSAPAGLTISWLEGKPEFSPRNQADFGNPLSESCEDKWENIWKD
jgi:Holliday junction resolvase-like predicted endonuclease